MLSADVSPHVNRQHAWLMAAARDPGDIATLALGGVMARFALQGMDAEMLQRLLARHFPIACGTLMAAPGVFDPGLSAALPLDEYADLHRLLREHRRDDSEENRWIIHAVASACAGDNHLWQDMGLPNREVLSQLIRRYFPVLFYKNRTNMKWKKFFYKQLCDRKDVPVCKSPSCGVCVDYAKCFGPEALEA